MTGELILRGVPVSVARDSWWLSALPELSGASAGNTAGNTARDGKPRWPVAILLGLVVLADVLFFGHAPGLSLALFALALVAAVWWQTGARRGAMAVYPGVVALLAALPVVEEVQALSVLIQILGTGLSVVWLIVGATSGVAPLLTALVRFAGLLPGLAVRDLGREYRSGTGSRARTALSAARHGWALPVLAGLGFGALLVSGNPILARWLDQIATAGLDPVTTLRRAGFWVIAAALIWPFVTALGLSDRLTRPVALPLSRIGLARGVGWINAASVGKSLVLCNLLFLVQTVLDLAYLWGGAALPEGMTYAQYAHRGAYPLVATALLAGLFAIVSRPYTEGRRLLRLLLLIWIGQNLLLVISSLYRLDLYIGVFGLTYLRVHAAIWMAMVAVGLALTGWQAWRGFGTAWLLKRNAVLLAAVLYTASFVNFAGVIASYNLSPEQIARMQRLDHVYLCRLGPNAAAAIAAFNRTTGNRLCPMLEVPQSDGWRDWGFRTWRVRGYLGQSVPQPEEGP